MKNIVIINGGRGASSIIPALLEKENVSITSIVNAYDDGKSTGEIRRFFNMLGPSDLRKVQQLFLPESDHLDEHNSLFDFRYPLHSNHGEVVKSLRAFANNDTKKICNISLTNTKVIKPLQEITRSFLNSLQIIEQSKSIKFNFSDCSIMNCLYAGAFLINSRNIERTADYFKKVFDLKGSVIPNCIENRYLVAQRENGEVLKCEAEIVELRSSVKIRRIYLLENPLDEAFIENLNHKEQEEFLKMHDSFVELSKTSLIALENADIIIYSSGTQHSSLYPTYMTRGFGNAIAKNSKAFKVFITNIGADYETPSYKASDFIKGAHKYLNVASSENISFNKLFNTMLINQNQNEDNDNYVKLDNEELKKLHCKLKITDLESRKGSGKHCGSKTISEIFEEYKNFLK